MNTNAVASPLSESDTIGTGLLLWALYHHQGASSAIGQPIREFLGIGQHDELTNEQVGAGAAAAMLAAGIDKASAPIRIASLEELALADMLGEAEQNEIEQLKDMLSWAYSKLHYRSFDNMDDALMLDRIKLELTGGGE